MIGKVLERSLRDFGFREPTRKANSIVAAGAAWPQGAHGHLRARCSAPALSGCILGTERPDLNLEVPAAYREGGRGAPDAHVPALDWWRGFRSSELTSLMDAAQIYNLDIAVAIAQIVQADAQVGVAGAPLLPSVTGTVNGRAGPQRRRSNRWRRHWLFERRSRNTASGSPQAT